MQGNRSKSARWWKLAVAAGIAFLALPLGAVEAQIGSPISSCPATCSSNCYLQTNLTCTNGNGVLLTNGANLDMAGNSITCTSGTCTNAAVTMQDPNSIVFNNLGVSGVESVITGPWLTGVQCNNKTGSEVVGIAIKGIGNSGSGSGVNQCAKVEGNVFLGQGNASNASAIRIGAGTANSDYARDNYIDDWFSGVQIFQTTKDVSVDHNLIVMRAIPLSTSGVGIQVHTTTNAGIEIINNVIMGDATLSLPIDEVGSGPPPSVYSANYCDPTLGTVCSDCQSFGFCAPPVAPFTMP